MQCLQYQKKSSGESLHRLFSQISDTKMDSKTSSKTTSKTNNKDVQNDETCTILEDNSTISHIKKTFTVKSFVSNILKSIKNELGSGNGKQRPKSQGNVDESHKSIGSFNYIESNKHPDLNAVNDVMNKNTPETVNKETLKANREEWPKIKDYYTNIFNHNTKVKSEAKKGNMFNTKKDILPSALNKQIVT